MIWTNQPIHLFSVGCLHPCPQGTNGRVGSPPLQYIRPLASVEDPPSRSSSRPAPRRGVYKIPTIFLRVGLGHRVGQRNDLDEPTHRLVPWWMPSPLPPRNRWTGWLTPTPTQYAISISRGHPPPPLDRLLEGRCTKYPPFSYGLDWVTV